MSIVTRGMLEDVLTRALALADDQDDDAASVVNLVDLRSNLRAVLDELSDKQYITFGEDR